MVFEFHTLCAGCISLEILRNNFAVYVICWKFVIMLFLDSLCKLAALFMSLFICVCFILKPFARICIEKKKILLTSDSVPNCFKS